MFIRFFCTCILYFSCILKTDAQDADSVVQKALISSKLYERFLNYEAAIEELQKPEIKNHYLVHLRIAGLYYYLGRYTESMEHYKNAVLLEPESIEALNGLMYACYYDKKYSKAFSAANKILSVYPYHKNACLIAAELSMANMDYLSALFRLQKYLTVWPSDFDANISLANCLIAMKNKKEAAQMVSFLKNVYPLNASVLSLEKALK